MKVVIWKGRRAFCPGPFIVMYKNYSYTDYRHEYGHHLQYRKYGLVKYYFKVAFPSIFGWWKDKLFHRKWTWEESDKWYYSQPWEAEADLLGGVKRNYS